LKILIKLLLLVIVVFLFSCATGDLQLKSDGNTQYLIEKLKLYNKNHKTVNGKAFIFYKSGERASSFKAGIIADDNNKSLKIDINDFVFNNPLGSIVKNLDTILAISYIKKEYFYFNYYDFDFKKFIGFDIPKEIFLEAVFGKVYIISGNITSNSYNNSTLSIENSKMKEKIYLTNNNLPSKVIYSLEDGLYEIRFNKYIEVDNLSFPTKVVMKKDDKSLEINYKDVALNKTIDSNLFIVDKSFLKDYREVD